MTQSKTPSAQLIAEAAEGSALAVDRLLTLAWPNAYGIAYSILRDARLAEDAAQESCAILFRSISRLRAPGAYTVWFYRIALREALRLERGATPGVQIDAVEPASDSSGTDLRIDVLDALAKLPPRQRAAVVLHFYAGLNSREIADILAIPDSSVRFQIMRAKRTLERLLEDHAACQTRKEIGDHVV